MTFVAIVHHDIQPGKLVEAQERIDGNGDRMARQPGYRERYALHPSEGGDLLVTVTVWDSEEEYQGWVRKNRADNPHAGKPSPYVGSPRTSLYTAVSENSAPGGALGNSAPGGALGNSAPGAAPLG